MFCAVRCVGLCALQEPTQQHHEQLTPSSSTCTTMAHAAVVPQQQQQQLPVQQQPPRSSSKLVQVAKDVFAGTMGGISVTMVGHPFDTIKVRLQTQPMDKPIYCECARGGEACCY